MIAIYSDSQIIDLEWIPNANIPQPNTVYHTYEEYVNSTAEYKIAFTTQRLHCDYDINCTAYRGFEDKINKLSAVSTLVFTIESELHDFHWRMWELCYHDNVYWVVPGQVNDSGMSKNIIHWADWFKTTVALYRKLPDIVAKFDYTATKSRYFDALLGSPKPHRDFVNAQVIANNLQDKFIMTYGGQWNDNEFYAKDYFIWEPGTTVVEDNQPGTASYVEYFGNRCHLSQVIPLDVFNNTAYSIVAETDFDNTLSFFSEKTAKPLIYRRLFVAFSGYKFLQNLRDLGFRTFDNVIDESYDLIKDDTARLTAAFEQVKYLCSVPQSEIFSQIATTLDHNYNLIMSTDWTRRAAHQISDIIVSAQR